MKITDVKTNNWFPGFWEAVTARPTEPLIDTTITMTLSYAEYKDLLKQNEKHPDPNRP